ncbi:MAG: hypothetical protein P8K07_17960 [Candidatus Binatia bacterium]|nr:hypothetical protein [Candidatus Binatia bacterium]
MPSAKFLLLTSLPLSCGHLTPATAQAEPLQLCVRADRLVEGRPKEGAKIILRSQCKTRANGTPIEISIGNSDAIGGAEPCGSVEGVYTSGQESSSHTTVKISERNNSSSFKLEVLADPTNLGSAVAFTCNDFRPALGQTYGAYCSFETLTGDPGPYFFSRLDCDSIAAVGYSFVEDTLRRVGEVCGDGFLDPSIGEQCDDGQASDVCDADCTLAVCGDGTLNGLAGEVCDDGGTSDGDGCSADCQSDETCGNGITDTAVGEECDDGTPPSAVCDPDCTSAFCGDGFVNAAAGEVCDDGGTSDGDGCSANCLSDETCGNGFTDTGEGEECDPGPGGDFLCGADCREGVDGSFGLNGLWQVNWFGVWFGAHPLVIEGDKAVLYQRLGEAGGREAGSAVCARTYDSKGQGEYPNCPTSPASPWSRGVVPILPDENGFYLVPWPGLGAPPGPLSFFGGRRRLRQVVSCPGKSLEQILAGECVPEPSPSGAFVDGAPVW